MNKKVSNHLNDLSPVFAIAIGGGQEGKVLVL